jgi:hypothetical protein
MTSVRSLCFTALVLLASAGTAPAAPSEDRGDFVVRLGADTTSVEHYTRTVARVQVEQVGRAPRVLRRHFTYEYAQGAITHLALVVEPPGDPTPTQVIDATFGPDSMRMQIRTGTAAQQNVALVMPRNVVVIAGSSPWVGYEGLTMKLAVAKADSLRAPLWFLGAGSLNTVLVEKLGRDSVAISNDHLDVYHARVDRTGRILGVLPISGTAKFGAERVSGLSVDALAASFLAREKEGAGLGQLSPRDTVQVAGAGGATLWIDYGRPARRGRAIYGGIVPYGEVWRTGANAATQFRTDKALAFGDVVVPAGLYTLWTLPTATGWTLIVNGETGQWGTAHKPEKDLYRIPLALSALSESVERFTIRVRPDAQGGAIQLDWDTTRAEARFTTQP